MNLETKHEVTSGEAGSTLYIDFPFSWLEETDVKVYKGATLFTNWQFITRNRICIAPSYFIQGDEFTVRRETSRERAKVQFNPGGSIRAQDLNKNQGQVFDIIEEFDERTLDLTGPNTINPDITASGNTVADLYTFIGDYAQQFAFAPKIFQVKNSTPQTRIDGTPIQNGDIWLDTSNSNHAILYYYSGSYWRPITLSQEQLTAIESLAGYAASQHLDMGDINAQVQSTSTSTTVDWVGITNILDEIEDLSNVAGDIAALGPYYAAISNLGGITQEIQTCHTNAADIHYISQDLQATFSQIGLVAADLNSANSAIDTVATNIPNINLLINRYHVGTNPPTANTITDGMLWYDTNANSNTFKYWDPNSGGGTGAWLGLQYYSDGHVDSHLLTSTATNNQLLSWTGSDYDWIDAPSTYDNSDVDTHLNKSQVSNGYVLSWDASANNNNGDYSWSQLPAFSSTFLGLSDTPAAFTADKLLAVNNSGNAVVFVDAPTVYTDGDVDTHLNTPSTTDSKILSWNGTDYTWSNDLGADLNVGGLSETGASSGSTSETHKLTTKYNHDLKLQADGSAWVTVPNKTNTDAINAFSITNGGTDTSRNAGTKWFRNLNADSPGGGENAVFRLDTNAGGVTTVDKVNSGNSWAVNETITIPAADIPGSVNGGSTNDVVIRVDSLWTQTYGGGLQLEGHPNGTSGAYVRLSAPALGSSHVDLILPNSEGNAGDLLETNGSGVLSWTSAYTNGDVNTYLNTPAANSGSGNLLSWNGTSYAWVTAPTGVTNLSIGTTNATNVDVDSSTGTSATLPAATTTAAGLMTAQDKNDLGTITSVSGALGDITTVAGQIQPTNNISTVAGLQTQIAAVAGISPSDLQAVASAGATAIQTVANNINDIYSFQDTYFIDTETSGAPTSVNNQSITTGDLWYDTTNNVLKVKDASGWVNTTLSASQLANVNAVANDIAQHNDYGNINDEVTNSGSGGSLQTCAQQIGDIQTCATNFNNNSVAFLTGAQTLVDKTLDDYIETVDTTASQTAFNASTAHIFRSSGYGNAAGSTGEVTLEEGQSITVMVNPGIYPFTFVVPAGDTLSWIGGTPSVANSTLNVFEFFKVGTDVYGAKVGEI